MAVESPGRFERVPVLREVKSTSLIPDGNTELPFASIYVRQLHSDVFREVKSLDEPSRRNKFADRMRRDSRLDAL